MVGILFVVPVIGLVVGLIGRFLVPGRHGLVRFLRNDPKLAPKLLTRDDETRWEVGGGLIGAYMGYALGHIFDAQMGAGPSTMRWFLAVVLATLLVVIAIASGVIERSRFTRKLEIHS